MCLSLPSSFHSSPLCLRPFLSSSSFFLLLLLASILPLFSVIHFDELKKKILSYLPDSLIHSVHLPIQSFFPITSLLNRRLYCWALRHIVHANSVLHWAFEACCHYDTVQLASYWTDECFLKLWKWTGHLVWFLLVLCVMWCVIFARVQSECVSSSPPSRRRGATSFLTPRTCLVLAWCQSTFAPPLFSCRVRQCRWEVQEGEKKKHR